MGKISIIILLVLCLTLLALTSSKINTVTPGIDNENFGNQQSNTPNSNNYQNPSTDPIEEPVIEDPDTAYPQKWTIGDGTASNPWANDCIQKAYNACPAGGTIFLKAGYYILSDAVEITKVINIIGEDRNNTIIKTANKNGILVRADNCTLKGFTIDGDAQTDGTKYLSALDISHCDYAVVEDIKVKNAGYYGINIYEVNHSLFQNIHAHNNYRHGMHPGSDTVGRNKYNTYRNIYAWDNGSGGFDDRGSSGDQDANNVFDNLQCWDNGGYGIAIGDQSGSVLSNSFTSGNGAVGILIYNVEDINVHDCSTILDKDEGIHIISSENVNLTNVIAKNSDYAGIRIDDSSDIRLTSCQSYDDRETQLQKYGLELYDTNTGISLLNCILLPNKIGEIYNPAGVAVEVITEKKKLSKF